MDCENSGYCPWVVFEEMEKQCFICGSNIHKKGDCMRLLATSNANNTENRVKSTREIIVIDLEDD